MEKSEKENLMLLFVGLIFVVLVFLVGYSVTYKPAEVIVPTQPKLSITSEIEAKVMSKFGDGLIDYIRTESKTNTAIYTKPIRVRVYADTIDYQMLMSELMGYHKIPEANIAYDAATKSFVIYWITLDHVFTMALRNDITKIEIW